MPKKGHCAHLIIHKLNEFDMEYLQALVQTNSSSRDFPLDMGQVYASKWLEGLLRTKGCDFFESLVHMLRLTSNYHLEV